MLTSGLGAFVQDFDNLPCTLGCENTKHSDSKLKLLNSCSVAVSASVLLPFGGLP